MITNREISSRALLEEALDELVESARENEVPDETLAAALRARAAEIDGDAGPGDGPTGDQR